MRTEKIETKETNTVKLGLKNKQGKETHIGEQKIMKSLMKVMLLAVLALPFSSAFAAGPGNNQVEVDITVNLSVIVNIAFADVGSPTTESWVIAATLGGVYDTTGGPVVDIVNSTGDAVSVTAAIQDPTIWHSNLPVGDNSFTIVADPGNITLGTGAVPYETIGASGPAATTASNKLTFTAPATVTTTSPGGVIKVVFVATAL